MILLLTTATTALAINAIIVNSYNRDYNNKNSSNSKTEGNNNNSYLKVAANTPK